MSIDDVTDLTPRVRYVASAAQEDFDYPFPIFQAADLVVIVDDVEQTLTTDYTVTGEGEDLGGTVTFVTPMTGGEIVTIYRDTVIERLSDQQQNGPIASVTTNDEFDKAYTIMQELKAKIGRAIRFPFTAAATDTQTELNPLSSWLGKLIRISSGGIPEPVTVADLDGEALSPELIGGVLYPRTLAEIAAGVTPVNYQVTSHEYDGKVRAARYGFSTSASGTANYAALVNAYAVAAQAGCALTTADGVFSYTPTAAIQLAATVDFISEGQTQLNCDMTSYSGVVFQQLGSSLIRGIYGNRTGTKQGTFLKQEPTTVGEFTGHQRLEHVWGVGFARNIDIGNTYHNHYYACRFNGGTTGVYCVPSAALGDGYVTVHKWYGCEFLDNDQNVLYTSTLQSRGVEFWSCSDEGTRVTASTFTKVRGLHWHGAYFEGTNTVKAFIANDCSLSTDGQTYLNGTAGITLGTNTEANLKGVRAVTSTDVLTGGDSTQVVSMEDCQWPSSGNSVAFLRFVAINSQINGTWYQFRTLPDDATHTLTLTGCTTSPTGNATATVDARAREVTLLIPQITGTSNSTSATLTGLPASLRPATSQNVIGASTDNGANIISLMTVQSGGTIVLFNGVNSSGFTASGTKGLPTVTIKYSLA